MQDIDGASTCLDFGEQHRPEQALSGLAFAVGARRSDKTTKRLCANWAIVLVAAVEQAPHEAAGWAHDTAAKRCVHAKTPKSPIQPAPRTPDKEEMISR